MSNDVVIERVVDDFARVSTLARKIWMQHFVSIIGVEQVNFMLDKFQSTSALIKQIDEGYDYFLVKQTNKAVGYFGLLPVYSNKKLQISKFYLLAECRGRGIGKRMLDFIETRSIDKKISLLWLTVNKYNHDSIAWYSRRGFEVVDEVKLDIGSGYFMDDYIMQKNLSRALKLF